MSIVGTRPPLISETNLYEPRHKVRLAIKPGITGMWQVSGRSDITDFEEVVRLDKEYIENWDIGLDIKILLKTVMVASNVLVTNENHGINPESTTPYMDQKLSAQDVKIGNGCWIGEKVSILSGVTIGEKCIIGAGSIVTKSIPSYSIAVGNPARIIKQYNFYTKRWERYYGEDEKR